MTTPKEPRKPPFWQLPGTVSQLPNGAKIQEESLGADQVLLHVTFPEDIDSERVANFAQVFGREMPKNVKAVFTTEAVKINVVRPRSVSISIINNTIESRALLEQIRDLISDQNIQSATIIINNNIIEGKLT